MYLIEKSSFNLQLPLRDGFTFLWVDVLVTQKVKIVKSFGKFSSKI